MQKKLQRGAIELRLIVIVLLVIASLVFIFWQKISLPRSIISLPIKNSNKDAAWTETGVVIAGAFTDADVVDLENGTFRMYYSAEPEIPGFNGQVYSAVSSDGVNWDQEIGIRLTSAIFPSVVKLTDNSYRMYFQEQQEIRSAVSADGLTWEREPGTRINIINPAGLNLSGVVAPTVMKIGNEYLMVYGGVINQVYPKEKVPSKDTHLLLWATSKDGLIFKTMGIALDSRNEVFKGWQDGPELVAWDDDTIQLYFWGYFGIYQSTFENGAFSEPIFVFYGPSFDKNVPFPSSPPGDPTLVKINDSWNMYYGYHAKGIYRAILNN